MTLPALDMMIENKIGEVRTEATDISFGEIISLHSSDPREMVIQPEYQRLFRWSTEQRSRLVESIILQLPIPQIFVIENENGVLELIDGLQRVSSVIHFMNHQLIEPVEVRAQVAPNPLRLSGCDIITELNGKTFDDLPLTLRLRVKRSSVRMITIKKSSSHLLRYEMFKRLNTGGSELSPQEIRNCTSRMVGEPGIRFYTFLQECADYNSFRDCTGSLPDENREQKGDEELVLRFFATKNIAEEFRGSVRDWLDDYIDAIILGKREFDYMSERLVFRKTFDLIAQKFGDAAFVKYRGGNPTGGLAPAYFEAVSVGLFPFADPLMNVDRETMRGTLGTVLESPEFRSNTGASANTRNKLRGRINILSTEFAKLV